VIQPVRERAALEALPVTPMDVRDVEALRAIPVDETARELHGVIGGVVEDLDGEALARIVELGGGSQQSREHIALVVDRQLYDDVGKLAVFERGWVLEPAWATAAIERNEYVAIEADQRQQEQRDTVDDQSSARDHLLDGGRMTERGGSHGRRDSHDENHIAHGEPKNYEPLLPLTGRGINFLMLGMPGMFRQPHGTSPSQLSCFSSP